MSSVSRMSNAAAVYYLTLPVESANQASSLTSYLRAHGIEAIPAGPAEVTVVVPTASIGRDSLKVHHIHRTWNWFWEHSDSEVYGLPVFTKPSTDCPEC